MDVWGFSSTLVSYRSSGAPTPIYSDSLLVGFVGWLRVRLSARSSFVVNKDKNALLGLAG